MSVFKKSFALLLCISTSALSMLGLDEGKYEDYVQRVLMPKVLDGTIPVNTTTQYRDDLLGDNMCHLRAIEAILRKRSDDEGFRNQAMAKRNALYLAYAGEQELEAYGDFPVPKGTRERLRALIKAYPYTVPAEKGGMKKVAIKADELMRYMRARYLEEMYAFLGVTHQHGLHERTFPFIPIAYKTVPFFSSVEMTLKVMEDYKIKPVVLLMSFGRGQNAQEAQLTKVEKFYPHGRPTAEEEVVVFEAYRYLMEGEAPPLDLPNVFSEALLGMAAVHSQFIDRQAPQQIHEDILALDKMPFYVVAHQKGYGVNKIEQALKEAKEIPIPLNMFHVYAQSAQGAETQFEALQEKIGGTFKLPVKKVVEE